MQPTQNASWIIKAIVKQQNTACGMFAWNNMVPKFETKRVYNHIKVNFPNVDWRHIFYRNLARPRPRLFFGWLVTIDWQLSSV
ncbi:unnamed protein product [Lathyrus oleraceus]